MQAQLFLYYSTNINTSHNMSNKNKSLLETLLF